MYGLSCDNVLAVTFVDAKGNIRVANSTSDHERDMFWMARGSGGEFPGIVLSFTAIAYPMPEQIIMRSCNFEYPKLKDLLRAYIPRMEQISQPERSLFSDFKVLVSNDAKLSLTCYDCSGSKLDWFNNIFDEIMAEAGGSERCSYWSGTWMDRLLMETWDDYRDEEDVSNGLLKYHHAVRPLLPNHKLFLICLL